MRALIIGCGGAGNIHANILKDLSFTLYASDIDKKKEKKFCSEHNIKGWGEEDVDIVVIATPVNSHKDLVVKFLNQDKWVICEKPFALTVEECDEMILTSKKNGHLSIAESNTYSQDALDGPRKLLKTGRPCIWNANYMTQYRPRSWFNQIGGGAFFEGGIHLVTTAKYLFGESVKWYSSVRNFSGGPQSDSGTIMIDYLSGDSLNLSIFWGVEDCIKGNTPPLSMGCGLIGPKSCEWFGPYDDHKNMWDHILNGKEIVTPMMARNAVFDIQRCLAETWTMQP